MGRRDMIADLQKAGLVTDVGAVGLGADETAVLFNSGDQGVAVTDATSTAAQGTLTLDTQPTDGDTYIIDTKTYTFEDSLTDVDGNVAVGGSLAQAQLNLVAAMDLSGVAGTDYATSMTAHASVDIAAFVSDNAVLTAKTTGVAGDSIATTENFFAGTNVFDAVTLGTTTAGVDGTLLDLRVQLNILLAELRTMGVIAT